MVHLHDVGLQALLQPKAVHLEFVVLARIRLRLKFTARTIKVVAMFSGPHRV